jgi:hypothetical protein
LFWIPKLPSYRVPIFAQTEDVWVNLFSDPWAGFKDRKDNVHDLWAEYKNMAMAAKAHIDDDWPWKSSKTDITTFRQKKICGKLMSNYPNFNTKQVNKFVSAIQPF